MFYFNEVSLVIRKVWVLKTLASQRSLSRKLLKEASRGSFPRKPLEKSFSRKLPEVVSVKAPSYIH